MRNRLLTAVLITVLLFTGLFPCYGLAEGVTPEEESPIDRLVADVMDKSGIPGVSTIIVKDGKTWMNKGFGYADKEEARPVTPDTAFELGSNSKAFTGLAVLKLAEEGKFKLEDPVAKFLPWFEMEYKGLKAEITLEQLLHHTSGIPFSTIGDIPAADGNDALEHTVQRFIGQELDFEPGEQFLYATLNYDILGLVIQKISGQAYEDYMLNSVFQPLGLNHTYIVGPGTTLSDSAKGYQYKLLRTLEDDAPLYRGNAPAGYVMSNAIDMERWLKIQMGLITVPAFSKLIEESHMADRSVSPDMDGASYAAGWSVYQKGSGQLAHQGNNPGFSSYIGFRPGDGIGVVLMTNLNSTYTLSLGENILQTLLGKKLTKPPGDLYKNIDRNASLAVFILFPVMGLIGWFFLKGLSQIAKGQRRFEGSFRRTLFMTTGFVFFLAGFAYCLYRIPDVIFWGLNWNFVRVWAPESLIYAILSLFIVVVLFGLYYLFTELFPKKDDKTLFNLIVLSLASGFGNALLIFVVNETFNRGDEFQGGLLLYFLMGIAVYVVGQKLVRTRLIHVANQMVYEKRSELTDKILRSSYQKIDSIEYGRIQASLNNDTEVISEFSNIINSGATSLVTLLCCFTYMGMISFYGLLVSVVVVFIAAGLHFLIGRQAYRLWEQTRDIQNTFFKFINDLVGGFKELTLHEGKKQGFRADMQHTILTYKDKRVQGDMKYANVNVIGELLFSIVIGVVAFLFPLIFSELTTNSLRSYVFVLLYMTGPIHSILAVIPNITKVRISWMRIRELSDHLDTVIEKNGNPVAETAGEFELKLDAVRYDYKNAEGEKVFSVGPLDYSFRSGEITFITGGNGSGKSTLSRLITGLYAPDSGTLYINGDAVSPAQLGQHFAAVFSDFYLFEKLYGIDYDAKSGEMEHYLNVLHLDEKVRIKQGALNTIKLSTGQRKRLALLVSYLEDRPVYLFDEWAADQDPEFRQFFYLTLLPELRSRGKCIIAVTHDDRYFDTADRVIKMEMGKIVKSEIHPAAENTISRDKVV
ncbi:cyclic peptide export ABC transporter [Paenibacillus sp. sgz500958]|uniref:cyclic peptide export ABC transporter n=1 Tax=Paenibacillus sp. sgz500958 TaxID=3242475 RepID=UPI0036D35AD5